MQPLTERQLEALSSRDPQALAEWWCELNRWRWPDALPDPEPPEEFTEGGDIRWSVMCEIRRRIGERLIRRVWNKDMPDEVFESMMRGERGRGTPYGDWSAAETDRRMAQSRAREDRTLSAEVVLEDILDAEYLGEE